MGVVAYDRPFSQVGFRPTRKTDPFAAAHRLSGMGDAAAPSSGVPNGALITYSGTWETTVHNSNPQDILRQVTSGLPGLKVVQQDIQFEVCRIIERCRSEGRKLDEIADIQIRISVVVDIGHGHVVRYAVRRKIQRNLSSFEVAISLVQINVDPIVAGDHEIRSAIFDLHADQTGSPGLRTILGDVVRSVTADSCSTSR